MPLGTSPLVDLSAEYGARLHVHPDRVDSISVDVCQGVASVVLHVGGVRYCVGQSSTESAANTLADNIETMLWPVI